MKNNDNFISEVPGQILHMGRGEKTKIVYSQSNMGEHILSEALHQAQDSRMTHSWSTPVSSGPVAMA